MNTLKLLWAEIRYRKLNFVLSLSAVTMAVTLFVAGPVLIDGYGRETRAELKLLEDRVVQSQQSLEESEKAAARELAELEDQTRIVMRDLGFNLSVLHRNTDLVEFLANSLPKFDMPQEYVQRLAGDPKLTMVTHLVATMQSEIEWQDPSSGKQHTVRLVAYLPETTQSHKRHATPMGYDVEPGTVFLGYRLGQDKEVDGSVDVLGETFRIARVLPEKGNHEDSSITMHLADGQRLLDRPGAINQILALECRCAESDLPVIRQQVADILPETVVIRDRARAVARSRQRNLVSQKHANIVAGHRRDLEERRSALEATVARRQKIQLSMETLAAVITALVVLVAAIWVGLLALSNVRERRTEIGVFRALGRSSARIAALLLGKSLLLGVLGAVLGFLAGAGIGYALGTDLTQVLGVPPLYAAGDHFTVPYHMLWLALLGASTLSLLASYVPTLIAVRQDPAVVVREL